MLVLVAVTPIKSLQNVNVLYSFTPKYVNGSPHEEKD